uniref:leucine-rich melanocyte differentiation-associated protein n=1 Tax=Pristiophorus japonicus TaxID=55135 RepID=UPI00398F0D11
MSANPQDAARSLHRQKENAPSRPKRLRRPRLQHNLLPGVYELESELQTLRYIRKGESYLDAVFQQTVTPLRLNNSNLIRGQVQEGVTMSEAVMRLCKNFFSILERFIIFDCGKRLKELIASNYVAGVPVQVFLVMKIRRLSFAHQNLQEMPFIKILRHADSLEELDLSHNCLNENLSQLGELKKLTTFILDGNSFTSHIKFAYMPSLTTLWINKNKITNLAIFAAEIAKNFPQIRILSMMNNEAAPSYFNGGSLQDYVDYRHYVISQIPSLKVLDDKEVMPEERMEAERIYRPKRSKDTSRNKEAKQNISDIYNA